MLTSDCRYLFTLDLEVSIVLVLILRQPPWNAEWTGMKLTAFFTLNNEFLNYNMTTFFIQNDKEVAILKKKSCQFV